MVEPQPSKLVAWVRFPSPAIYIYNSIFRDGISLVKAHIAQTVEHFLGKEEVAGSSPVVGSVVGLDSFKGESSNVERKI